jgi:hypothetical protein
MAGGAVCKFRVGRVAPSAMSQQKSRRVCHREVNFGDRKLTPVDSPLEFFGSWDKVRRDSLFVTASGI